MEVTEEVLSTILDETSSMMTLIDPDTHTIVYANKAAQKMAQETIGLKDYVGTVCYENLAHLPFACKNCILNRRDDKSAYTRILRYKDFTFELHYAFLDIAGHTYLLERAEDVSDKAHLADSLKEIQRAVRVANVFGDVSIWTYDLDKHEIRQQVYQNDHMGYPLLVQNVPQCFVESGNIPAEEADAFYKFYEKIEQGAPRADGIFRLRSLSTGEYEWQHMFYLRDTSIDQGSRVAYGFALNVSQQQEQIDRYIDELAFRRRLFENTVLYYQVNMTQGILEEVSGSMVSDARDFKPRKVREDFGQDIVDKVAEPDKHLVKKLFPSRLIHNYERGETSVTVEYRRIMADGTLRWVRGTAIMATKPDSGDVVAFVFIQDIDKEKRSRLAQLAAVDDDLESIFLVARDDDTPIVVRSRPEMEAQLKEHAAKGRAAVLDFALEGAVAEEPYSLEEFNDLDQLSQTVREEGEDRIIFSKMVDGAKQYRQVRVTFLDESEAQLVFVTRNVTAIYNQERKRKLQLEAAVREAISANDAKTAFFSRMSHDMRTPMNGILGLVALSEDVHDADKLKSSLAKIGETGLYLLGLINDTLDFERIESGKMELEPQATEVAPLLENALDAVRPTAIERNVDLRVKTVDADVCRFVYMDPLRVRQVFSNLLSNAVKFTPEGGVVELEVRALSRQDDIIHTVISVTDTGLGMSEDFLKHKLFQPFAQESNAVTSKYAGSGLGLSIVKSLVDLMGGRIEVESELGAGSKFSVYLDFKDVPASEVAKAREAKAEHVQVVLDALKGVNVLLAEDNLLNCEIARGLLEKVGCKVAWAKDGNEVVDTFRNSPAGSFDIILMDIRMPGKTGLQAAMAIRGLDKRDAKTIPIVAMTANAYPEDVRKSFAAGMNAHLAKPVHPQELYESIANLLKSTD